MANKQERRPAQLLDPSSTAQPAHRCPYPQRLFARLLPLLHPTLPLPYSLTRADREAKGHAGRMRSWSILAIDALLHHPPRLDVPARLFGAFADRLTAERDGSHYLVDGCGSRYCSLDANAGLTAAR